MSNLGSSNVLLIWPYGIEGAESIPMCMSFLVPQLTEAGVNVSILDCSLFNVHPRSEKFENTVRQYNPDVIGISSWSQNWRWVGKTINAIRDVLPNVPIVLGGPHVTATGDTGKADYALTGEPEHTFPQLVKALASGEQVDAIPGVRYMSQLLPTPPALIKDLDGLGLPNFDAMFLNIYQEHGYRYRTGERKQAPILATRGCPYVCAFCEAPFLSGRKIRAHSIAYLKELLTHLRQKWDVTHVNIVDDNFTFYKNYAKEFCEMVINNQDLFGGMTFATPNGIRVEKSDAEMFQFMSRAGWQRVIFAPESGSQRMVDIMAKHLDLDIMAGKVDDAHSAGLEVEAFFIMNYPGETEEDVELTRRFIEQTPFDSISLHIFKPLPHTPIWRELIDNGSLSPEYVVGRYDEIDWLANGKNKADIAYQVIRYQAAAKSVYRVA